MALEDIEERYIPKDNNFYRHHYHQVIIGLIVILFLALGMVGFVLYQTLNRPVPLFYAVQPNKEEMQLRPYDEPNLLPETIVRWASKAAAIAYTFDYVQYQEEISAARPYFTEDGWQDYLVSINPLIQRVTQGQLFVVGVVAGTPIIANQGPLPGKGYVWRVQIPFLVTYQSANSIVKRNFIVVLTIVRVPTSTNPQGIGIDQFVMV